MIENKKRVLARKNGTGRVGLWEEVLFFLDFLFLFHQGKRKIHGRSILLIIGIVLGGINIAKGQVDTVNRSIPFEGFKDEYRGEQSARIVFYNVENLFDIYDDPEKNDDEFTPESDRHWDKWKYNTKIVKIGKTLISIGGWEPPAIIGLCEIENRDVLADLVGSDAMLKADYEIVHIESRDKRGIDVALLYRKEKFELLYQNNIRFPLPEGERPTRDILHVKGILLGVDTIHFFINHWPSRYGGHLKTEPKRVQAASILRAVVDSLYATNPNVNIIATGDFNDHAEDKSMRETLAAKPSIDKLPATNGLLNLMYNKGGVTEGSHKFAGKWGTLDQFVVSTPLVRGESKLAIDPHDGHFFNAWWLLQKDERNFGYKPFRSFQGPMYIGGYSDHLPIYLDVIKGPH